MHVYFNNMILISKFQLSVFARFKGDAGATFREHLVSDVRGMLQLYVRSIVSGDNL